MTNDPGKDNRIEKNSSVQHPQEHTVETPPVPEVNTDFMKEEIRQRPLNKKRLLRRTVVTACLAVLFGAVACIVFLLLEPVINNAINPSEEPAAVTFPEETTEEEMSPEDMIANDEEIQEAEAEKKAASMVDIDAISKEVLAEVRKELAASEDNASQEGTTAEYEQLYSSLQDLAEETAKAVVTVNAVTKDYDWVGDAFNNTGTSSGLIVAQRGENILILTGDEDYESAAEIRISFHDGQKATAQLLAQDSVTGLTILSVPAADLSGEIESNDQLAIATLGSSERDGLVGSPVIAIGSPAGTAGSVSYGVATNAGLALDVIDSDYQQITTDISGSKTATGALINLSGNVIGWIDMQYQTSDAQNLICATGITDLKALIEKMSNETPMGYLGIHGTEVPEDVQKEEGIPQGAYIVQTELDSPAMNAGIQSGDVITSFAGKPIGSYQELIEQLENARPNRQVSIELKRRSGTQYIDVSLMVSLGSRLSFAE